MDLIKLILEDTTMVLAVYKTAIPRAVIKVKRFSSAAIIFAALISASVNLGRWKPL